MSAGIITTYGASRPVQLVPTEIWLTVMRNIMPEEFLWTTVPIPFSAYRRTMPAEFPDLRTLKGALRTLHSLALASKLFLASAIELLYEVVLIETESDAICLHNTLVRAQAHKLLATRTRHLILTGLIAPAFPFIAPIIRSMDSLSIFSAFPVEVAVNDNSGASMCWPGEIAVALQETCGHSLRKLHLHYNSFIFLSPSQLSDMLACMPRLQTLIIQEPALCRSLRLPRLSDLTFLVAQAGIGVSPGVEALFPSLSHLYLEPIWWSFDPGDILQRLGPRLSNLTLDMTNLSTTTNAIRRFREHHLSFPVVTHVQLILPWLQRPNLSLLPPGVTHLAIWWDCPPPAFDDDSPEVLSWLLSLAVIFCQWKVGKDESALTADLLLSSKVKLDVIRFANPAHAQWLRGILDINMSKLPLISEHGDLRIEGPTGELFPIFGG